MSKKINESTLRYGLVSLYELVNELCCYDHDDESLELELNGLRTQLYNLVNMRLPILDTLTVDEHSHE